MPQDPRVPPPTPGDWWTQHVHHHLTGVLRCVHILPLSERDLGLHVLDVAGTCPCRPKETSESQPEPAQWVHNRLHTVN